MEINTALGATKDELCEITLDPCCALLFAIQVQDQPIVGRPGIDAPVERVIFGCYGTMGIISFSNEEIIFKR